VIPAFVQNLGNTSNKTAGTTLALTTTGATTAGNVIVACVLFDNFTTASKPIVSSITKMAGETNNWLFLGAARSTSTSAGAFSSGEMWCIQTTVNWSAAAYTVTLDSSVTQKAILFTEFSGTQAILRNTVGTAYSTTITQASGSTSGTVPSTNDLALGFMFGSNSAAVPFGCNGWTPAVPHSVGSTGGSAATNNFGGFQYKLSTGTHETYLNAGAMTAGNGSICAVLQPIPEPTIAQAAYRLYDEAGTESGAAALAAQDTALTANPSTGDGYGMIRVRLQSTNSQTVPATDDYRLQWERNANGAWTSVVAASVAQRCDWYSETNAGVDAQINFTTIGRGQSFLGNGQNLSRVGMWLKRIGTAPGTVSARLYAHSGTYGTSSVGTGTPLANATTVLSCSAISTAFSWVYFDFDPTYTLVNGTPYVVEVFTSVTGTDASNTLACSQDTTGAHGGNATQHTTGWSALANDQIFDVSTVSVATPTSSLLQSWPETYRTGNKPCYLGTTPTGVRVIGQYFIGNGEYITKAAFHLSKTGTPTGQVVCHVYGNEFSSNTVPLAVSTTSIDITTLTTTPTWYEFIFDGTVKLNAATAYQACFRAPSGTTAANTLNLSVQDTVTGSSPGPGNFCNTWDDGVTPYWTGNASVDTMHAIYTTTPVLPYDNPNLTEGQATTNRLTGGTGTFVPGKVSELGHVQNIGWAANNFTEILYSVKLIAANLAGGDVLRFRVVRNDSTASMTYTVTPTVNLVTTPPIDLFVQDAAHAHAADNITITQFVPTVLVVQDAAHAHVADNTVLTQITVTNLVVADALHAHTAANIAVGVDIAVQAATHAHVADNVAVGVSLVVAAASHTSVSDNVTITYITSTTLVVDNGAHAVTSGYGSGAAPINAGITAIAANPASALVSYASQCFIHPSLTYVASAGDVVTSMSIYHDDTVIGDPSMAIYQIDGGTGNPTNRIGAIVPMTMPASSGWITKPCSIALTAGVRYGAAIKYNEVGSPTWGFRYGAGPGGPALSNDNSTGLSSVWSPSGGTDTQVVTFYATITPVGGGGIVDVPLVVDLAVQSASHAQAADNAVLVVPSINLVTQDAVHVHTAANVALGVDLVVQSATNLHTTGPVVLVQVPTLLVNSGYHTITPVAGPYHEPLLGKITTPNPGPLSSPAFTIVAKVTNLRDVYLAYQSASAGVGDWWNDYGPFTFMANLRVDPANNRTLPWFTIGDPVYSGNDVINTGTWDSNLTPTVPYWAFVVTLTPNYTMHLYWSVDGVTWTAAAYFDDGYGPYTPWVTNYPITIGPTQSFNAPYNTPKGSFYWVEMRSGTNPNAGAVQWRMDVAEYAGGAGWTDARGRTWTLSNPASIIPDTKLVENSSLVVQSATHAHTADNVAIAGGSSLAVVDGVHVHTADNVVLNYVVLAPADAVHLHTAANVAIDVVLVVQSAVHDHTAANVAPLGVDMVVQGATHQHTADAPTLQMQGDLALQNALHLHSAGNVDLTQAHNIAVDSAAHAHTADNVAPLYPVPNLVVAAGAHLHTADNVALDVVLVVQSANHVHISGNVDLVVDLAVQSAAHVHLADAPVLYPVPDLVVASAVHAHTSVSPVIGVDPAVQSAAHAVTSPDVIITPGLLVDNATNLHEAQDVSLSGVPLLIVQPGFHAHTADNVAPLGVSMAVQDAAHAHSADNVTPLGVSMVVASATHAHAADNLIITPSLIVSDGYHIHTASNVSPVADLFVQAAAHALTSDSPTLVQTFSVVVADAVHAVTSDNVTLTQQHVLVVAFSTHAHTADNIPSLSGGSSLVVAASLHAVTSTNVGLTQDQFLAIDSAQHGHTATSNLILTGVAFLLVQATSHLITSPEVDMRGIVVLNQALAVYLGGTPVSRIYCGSALVWPSSSTLDTEVSDGQQQVLAGR